MSDVDKTFQNLFDVIEKNKERFTLTDCHNFVVYINNIKKLYDAKKDDFVNLAGKYNDVVDKLNEMDKKIDILISKSNVKNNEI